MHLDLLKSNSTTKRHVLSVKKKTGSAWKNELVSIYSLKKRENTLGSTTKRIRLTNAS